MYVHTEFSISARTTLSNVPSVELARVERRSREDSFSDAQNPVEPGPNEIDLRFRRKVGAPSEVSIAVCYLGQVTAKRHGCGASYLARALNHLGSTYVSVTDDVPLAPGVEANTIIYLVGEGDLELSSGQMNGLFNHVNRGRGTLFIESIDSAAESCFLKILRDMEMELEALQPGHRLLTHPYLFAAPPPGFEPRSEDEDTPEMLVGDGVIFSTDNYGLAWQGEIRDAIPSRERIRSVIEWGGNIVAYARDRRRG